MSFAEAFAASLARAESARVKALTTDLVNDFAAAPFPTAPEARNEQRTLSIGGTIQGQYDAWLASVDGGRAFAAVESLALVHARAGTSRLSINFIVEQIRSTLQLSINNDFRALIARDLLETHPALKGLIEVRQRKAS